MIYRWTWKNDDGSDRKVEISTMMGVQVARQRALTFFPDDPHAQQYIMMNEPEIV